RLLAKRDPQGVRQLADLFREPLVCHGLEVRSAKDCRVAGVVPAASKNRVAQRGCVVHQTAGISEEVGAIANAEREMDADTVKHLDERVAHGAGEAGGLLGQAQRFDVVMSCTESCSQFAESNLRLMQSRGDADKNHARRAVYM